MNHDSIFAPLRHIGFVRLWIAATITNSMRWLEILVTSILVYELTGSAFVVALVGMMRSLPMLLIGAVVGAVAEAWDRKKLLLAGQIIMLTGSIAMATLSALGALQVWHLALAGLGTGFVWASDMAVRRRVMGEIVGEATLQRAMALDTTTNSVTRVVGPVLGGAAYANLGPTWSFVVTASCFALGLLLIRSVGYRQETRKVVLGRILGDIISGIEIARAEPALRAVILGTIVMNVFGFSYTTIAPAWGAAFSVSSELIGLLAAAEACGSFVGGLLLTTFGLRGRPAMGFVIGSTIFCASLIVAAQMSTYWPAFICIAFGGIGVAAFGAMQSTLVLIYAPHEARSRVLGLVTTGIGLGPIGALVIGALTDSLGPSSALLIMSVIGTALFLVLALPAALRSK
jgi:MFS family permease